MHYYTSRYTINSVIPTKLSKSNPILCSKKAFKIESKFNFQIIMRFLFTKNAFSFYLIKSTCATSQLYQIVSFHSYSLCVTRNVYHYKISVHLLRYQKLYTFRKSLRGRTIVLPKQLNNNFFTFINFKISKL